jgi:hypothetical protein
MRKTSVIATFVSVGARAVGVGANEIMKGSDTLSDVMSDVVATCLDRVSGANVPLDINYIGTGTASGEDAMTKVASPTQRIAPISRFLATILDNRPTTATTFGPRPIVGAFYRIHQAAGSYANYGYDPSGTRLTTPITPQCVNQDPTRQIGCLASVSNCSFGYAGPGALAGAAPGFTVDAVQQDALYPSKGCVQNLLLDPTGAYPIARSLFISTVFGFENASADENALVECVSKQSYISPIVQARGFIEMPVAPVCADLDEISRCALSGMNLNACANNNAIAVDPRVSTNGTNVPSNTNLVIP